MSVDLSSGFVAIAVPHLGYYELIEISVVCHYLCKEV